MHQIAELATHPNQPDALAEIARLARNALVASVPADPDHVSDTDHH
jgi:hypothetical protein